MEASSKLARVRWPTPRTWPRYVLVFDIETTVDAAQALLFGTYRFLRWGAQARLELLEEGFVHANDLRTTHPDSYQLLVDTCADETITVARGGNPRLMLRSRDDFVRKVFFRVAYRLRGHVVTFNAPFDLSRLAVHWGAADPPLYGGYSLGLVGQRDASTGEWKDSVWHPRVVIKSQDSKRAEVRFTRAGRCEARLLVPDGASCEILDSRYTHRGRFLDLKTLGFALTDRSHSLASLAKTLKTQHEKSRTKEHGKITPEYIAYARNDALVTAEVLEKLRIEFDTHPIGLLPERARSSASIAKAYWRKMGISPPLTRSPTIGPEVHGIGAAAYYGGRTECGVRKVPVPVVHTDFTSMYPTLYCLTDIHRYMIGAEIGVEDATAECQGLLDSITLDQCFDKVLWPRLAGFVQIIPDGDMLPIRADFDGVTNTNNVAVGPVSSRGEAMWYALPDVVASVLKTGRVPRVLRGIRLTATGQLSELKPVTFGGVVPIDPRVIDPIRALIEERIRIKQRTDLDDPTRERLQKLHKTCASAIGYGTAAEINREDAPSTQEDDVRVYTGNETFWTTVNGIETPGSMCFMPFASIVTAAARLMLTLLERRIAERGGASVFMDTDSASIVATEHGGPVTCSTWTPGEDGDLRRIDVTLRALSWREVREIVDAFGEVNPYDPSVLRGSILKIEDISLAIGHDDKPDKRAGIRPLWCYSIASKRYVFFTRCDDGGLRLVAWSKHGLGHLLDPTRTTDDFDATRLTGDADLEDDSTHAPLQTDDASESSTRRNWFRELWEYVLSESLGRPRPAPDWFIRPAVSRFTLSRAEHLKAFGPYNGTTPVDEQVRPFNFALVAYVQTPKLSGVTDAAGSRVGEIDVQRFRLTAPYDQVAEHWLSPTTDWVDSHTCDRYRLYTGDGPPCDPAGVVQERRYRPQKADSRPYVRVKSMEDIVRQYSVHPEAKRLGADGLPYHRSTVGILGPRPVVIDPRLRRHIGKEGNRIEEWTGGLLHDPEEVCRTYRDPARNWFATFVRPILECVPIRDLAKLTGLRKATLADILGNRTAPSPRADFGRC